MPDTSSFRAWLKGRRQALDLTQSDLAQCVGCSVDAIYRFEAGTRRPSKQIAARLAAVLEIPADQTESFVRLARGAPAAAPEQANHATGGGAAVPADAGATPHPANLPVPPTPLVGRDQEVAEVRGRLLREETRLLTLIGPAGVGKTRLSLAVAAGLLDEFDDGVFFVPLQAVADPDMVDRAIAGALGVREAVGEPLRETLRTYLRGRRLLLVLDNFEQVVAAATLLADLLSGCAGLKLLVTSREPLRLQSEWIFDLEGLSYPPDEAAGASEAYSAVRLFVQRAQQTQRSWVPAGSEARAVARICRLVEGLPLALEMAAAAVRERSCDEIARDLEGGLRVLATRARDVPERHRSMWAALEHSWQRLSEAERTVFPRLAVFRGGFEEAAAVAVAGASRNTLDELLARSLVRHTAQPGESQRYLLHELVRQYAAEKLRDAGEHTATANRHLQYYLDLAEAAAPRLIGREQAAWVARMEGAHENVRAALTWALESRQVTLALRLAAALEQFWYLRGYWSEGRAWLTRALAQSDDSIPALARARALFAAGELARYQSDYGAAVALLTESEALFQELGDSLGRALVLQGMAYVAQHQSDWGRARTLWEQVLPVFRAHGEDWRTGLALDGLGYVLLNQGDAERAEQLFAEGLCFYRRVGDKGAIADSLTLSATVALQRGDLARARVLCTEGILLHREIGHKHGLAWALRLQGSITHELGDYDQAEANIAESLQVRYELQDAHGSAWSLEGLAELATVRGEPERAARLWGAAEALREAIGLPGPADDRVRYERSLAAARAQTSPDRFTAAWAEGRGMSLDAAVTYALGAGP